MTINWEVILWCCITIVTILFVVFLVYYISSARALKKRREVMRTMLDNLKPGRHVLFAGGIKGKIVKVKEEYIDVEVAPSVVFTISLYSVNQVLD